MTQYTLGLTRTIGHGRAFTQLQTVTTPAAGAGFTYTNNGKYWELIDSLSFQMVTGGNAANRQVLATIKDGGGVQLAAFPSASVQTASLTWQYTFLPNIDTFNTVVSLNVVSPMAEIFLQPMFSLAVTVGAVDAADQISNIRLYTQRFVTGPQGYMLGVVDTDSDEFEELVRTTSVLA